MSEPDPAPKESGDYSIFSPDFKWLVSVALVPLVTLIVTSAIKQGDQAREDRHRVEARIQANAKTIVDLVPMLAEPDGSQKRAVALSVVAYLARTERDSTALGALQTFCRQVNQARWIEPVPAFGRASVPEAFDAETVELCTRTAQTAQAARSQQAVASQTGANSPANETQRPAPAPSSPTSQSVAPPTCAPLAARCPYARLAYLQIWREEQRFEAQGVQAQLRQKGLAVPGIENVGGRLRGPLGRAELRYFNPGDRSAAEWTRNQLGDGWTVSYVKLAGVPPGQLELWWPSR